MNSQWMPRGQLVRLQTERMTRIIEHAYRNVPMYRNLYASVAVAPSIIRNLASITKLPIVTKETFRHTPLEERTAAGIDLSSCRPISTSGSTGGAVTVLEDPRSVALGQALKLRFMWNYGVRPLDKICNIWYDAGPHAHCGIVPLAGFLPTLENLGLWGYIRRRRMQQFPLTTHISDHLAFMSRWKPQVLISPGSYCRALIRLCESVGKSLTFRLVITGGEMLDKTTRRLISDSFHAEVFDHYGANELGGTIAWECPTHSGYHINSEFLLLEFLRNGEPAKSGHAGEVHVTCFDCTATPIIRYALDDLATPTDDPCPCGRSLPRIKDIEGRKMDFILTPDGQCISPFAVTVMMESAAGVEQYRVLQRRDYSIEVSVRTDSQDINAVIRDVEQRCGKLFGKIPVDIRLTDVMTAPVDRKSRLVRSQVTD
jgi:phenylacetate-CoA ligase